MNDIDKCFRYQPDIKRLTKANSFTHQGRVIYIVKKDHEGKAIGMYIAYDYKTKIQLAIFKDKNYLIDFIKQQDLGVLSEVDI